MFKVDMVSKKTFLKDAQKEKAPSNKTPVLTKSMNMGIWVVGRSNHLFVIGSQTEAKLPKI